MYSVRPLLTKVKQDVAPFFYFKLYFGNVNELNAIFVSAIAAFLPQVERDYSIFALNSKIYGKEPRYNETSL